MIQRLLRIACVVVFLGACASSETERDPRPKTVVDAAAVARIDSTLGYLVTSGTVEGISALIYEQEKEVYFNALGMADREAAVPMARNTIVQIFSMTKPITGVALMTLFEEGAFDLDDPVSKYVPEFSDLSVYAGEDASGTMILESPSREMTIRDLTRHTSGLASMHVPGPHQLIQDANPFDPRNTLTRMGERLAGLPLWFHPGEQWAYGPSVDVQALLVESISGEPFAQYMREHVLVPLGMDETRYFIPESDRDRFAALYQRGEDGTLSRVPDEEAHRFNTQQWSLTPGGFGLTSTLDDYMRFAQMLVNEGELDGRRVLKPETVQLMATNHLPDSVTERSWLPGKGQVGFGIDFAVRVSPPATADENTGVVGEFFWDGAASTLFWVDPENELTAVLFVQVVPFDGSIHKVFRDAVYGPVRNDE